MSSLAISSPTHVIPTLTPFCDKNCKYIRVVADSASKACLALFYRIMSLVTSIFSTALSHHYDSLAQFEWFKIHYAVYRENGNEIVDFSTNSFTRVNERLPTTVTEMDALKTIYGAEAIDRWTNLWPPEQREIDELSRGEMVTEGCCFGMSLEFISSYLEQIKSGQSPEQAVKAIAPLFVHGASDRAQLAQIFYSAFHTESQKQRVELVDTLRKEALEWIASEKKRFKSLPREEFIRQADILQTQCSKRISEMQLKVENDCARGTLGQHHQKAASAFGLVQEEPIVYVMDKINVRPRENPEFVALVSQLPPGIYDLSLRSTVGHAIVYIKTTEGKHFIYDPSYATFAIDNPADSAARLWKTVRDYMTTKSYFAITFTPCTLR